MFCRISSIPNYFNRNSNRNRFISVTFEFVTICDICDQVWPGYKFKIVTYCDWRWPSQMHSVGPTLRSSPRTTFCLLTTCEQAHYISPHELVASSMAGKSARESQRRRGQSRDIKTGQATHLWDPDSAVGELGSDTSLPISADIAFSRLAPFHKTSTDFDKGN